MKPVALIREVVEQELADAGIEVAPETLAAVLMALDMNLLLADDMVRDSTSAAHHRARVIEARTIALGHVVHEQSAAEGPEVLRLRADMLEVKRRKEQHIEAQRFDEAAQARDVERRLAQRIRELGFTP
jgi:hypothetical protein